MDSEKTTTKLRLGVVGCGHWAREQLSPGIQDKGRGGVYVVKPQAARLLSGGKKSRRDEQETKKMAALNRAEKVWRRHLSPCTSNAQCALDVDYVTNVSHESGVL